MPPFDVHALIHEVAITAVRSGGKGGQNVNKVSTKVELSFSVADSEILSENQKNILQEKLINKLTKDGLLRLKCDESRSQHTNKELVIEKFLALVLKCFEKKKKRIATKPSLSAREKRLAKKKISSEKKEGRKKVTL